MMKELFNFKSTLQVLPYTIGRKLLTACYLLVFLFVACLNNEVKAGTVLNTNDTGTGSLRAVIAAAVAGETITISPGLLSTGSKTITLNTEIQITVPLTINGLMNGSDTLYISGNNTNRIFYCGASGNSSAIVNLNNLVLINGKNSTGTGGAIYCGSTYLRANNCIFRGNSAMNGAAIGFVKGDSWNHDVTVTNCSFSNNSSTRRGAAIYAESGVSTANSIKVNVNNSTISGNSAGWGAAAVYCSADISSANFPGAVSATINVNQSTISNNSGNNVLEVYTHNSNNSSSSSHSYLNITNSTIVDNGGTALSSTAYNTSNISIISSIMFGGVFNFRNPQIISGGDNLFSQSTLSGSVASDMMGVSTASVNLGTLQFNGGLTRTRVPLPGSIAINNGSSSTVNAQNGPILGIRDVGAAEQRSTFATQVITSCGPYTWINGTTYASSNSVATYTLPNSAGNDSIIRLNLTVLPKYNTTASKNLCPGSNYVFGIQTLTTSGTYTASFTAKNGCDSTVTLNLTLNDAIAPVPNIATLANITSQCSVNTLTAPTATDNCAGTITGTHNAALPIVGQGTTIVTWTYDDGNGNTSTQTQDVVISDNVAPVKDAAILSDVTGQCAVTSLMPPTATDNCAGIITGTHNATLPITTPGTTSVTWTYDDGHGNTTTQMQNVIITSPVATTSLSGLTITATTPGDTYQWIDCGAGNMPIAGATSSSFTASSNGSYAVIVTQNNCSATSTCVAISTVGLREITHTGSLLYPNPNNGVFTIEVKDKTEVIVTNVLGKVVLNEVICDTQLINLQHEAKGLYFIKLSENNQSKILKVIVE